MLICPISMSRGPKCYSTLYTTKLSEIMRHFSAQSGMKRRKCLQTASCDTRPWKISVIVILLTNCIASSDASKVTKGKYLVLYKIRTTFIANINSKVSCTCVEYFMYVKSYFTSEYRDLIYYHVIFLIFRAVHLPPYK